MQLRLISKNIVNPFLPHQLPHQHGMSSKLSKTYLDKSTIY